jgi:hypothetical protein
MASAEPPPDVVIAASARVSELRFHRRPVVRVSYPGRGRRASGQRTTRQNIDSPVQPGRTYRRVFAATTIASRLLGP